MEAEGGLAHTHMQLGSSQHERFFSVRIVSLDYYLAPPVPGLDVTFSSLEGTVVETVPIVRVFGSTPSGQRVCLHLHQVKKNSSLPPQGCSSSSHVKPNMRGPYTAAVAAHGCVQTPIDGCTLHTPGTAGLPILLCPLWQ